MAVALLRQHIESPLSGPRASPVQLTSRWKRLASSLGHVSFPSVTWCPSTLSPRVQESTYPFQKRLSKSP